MQDVEYTPPPPPPARRRCLVPYHYSNFHAYDFHQAKKASPATRTISTLISQVRRLEEKPPIDDCGGRGRPIGYPGPLEKEESRETAGAWPGSCWVFSRCVCSSSSSSCSSSRPLKERFVLQSRLSWPRLVLCLLRSGCSSPRAGRAYVLESRSWYDTRSQAHGFPSRPDKSDHVLLVREATRDTRDNSMVSRVRCNDVSAVQLDVKSRPGEPSPTPMWVGIASVGDDAVKHASHCMS